MKVIFFHRKPRPGFNFSIENLFKQIRPALPAEIDWEVREMRFYSVGFLKRLYITLEAAFLQKDVNHITGDIHFIALLLRRKRTILTVHDVGLMKHPNRWVRIILQWFWIILPVRRCAVITTVSSATKRELLEYVKVDPTKIKVVHNPISPLFTSSPKLFNKQMPRILQLGTKENKNIVRLIQALRGIPCILEIVGFLNDPLIRELKNAGVNFVNSQNLSDSEILDKYRASDIVAFVSTHEGFGLPIIEGNAIGRVVLTSSVSSMPEVAGNAAHLVDPFDVSAIHEGILTLIEDDAYREKLIANGYENAKKFDLTTIARQYAEIYKSVYAGTVAK